VGAKPEEIEAEFPDQQIIQGALVPFRRVWHQREVCHHGKVVNILKRYVLFLRSFLEPLLFKDERSMTNGIKWFDACELKPSNVIDLWLNTRYHHVGRGRPSLPSRDDFDRFNKELGPVLFEYYFLLSVFEFGIYLSNVLQCAEIFLKEAEAHGMRASFEILTIHDPRITRSTPGYTPATESSSHKVWRLRRRDRYNGVSRVFDLLELSDEDVAALLWSCCTFTQFGIEAGLKTESTDDFGAAQYTMDFDRVCAIVDMRSSIGPEGHLRRGFVGRRPDLSLVWAEDFLGIVSEQYLEMRDAFLMQPFK
jgi:hypothetical protein